MTMDHYVKYCLIPLKEISWRDCKDRFLKLRICTKNGIVLEMSMLRKSRYVNNTTVKNIIDDMIV